MESIIEILPLAAMMAATGVIAGVLAGLLGVGGGIVIVPVLDTVLGWYGVDPDIRMHIAVATSLACIVPTSISSFKSHQRKGGVDFGLIRLWGPAILIGALLGSFLASQLDSKMLSGIFGVVALIVAIKMLLPLEGISLYKDVPRGIAAPVAPTIIGALSSMMGIGGGTFSVPAMTLMNQPIHKGRGHCGSFRSVHQFAGSHWFCGSWAGRYSVADGQFRLCEPNWVRFDRPCHSNVCSAWRTNRTQA